ncbi:MAG: hypothetical protein BM565_04255 [Gammaproteobacteria bacterium MedPE]|nr:MAG: hypothetical protein BM565_04255 [Gammaproteobacteria bacterium MedPE]
MDNSINPLLRWLLAIGVFVLSIRLISLGFYPLYDTTEARYGEIARLMLETGNWVTPLFDYDVPFWGKPPLQTWISAASLGVFGINEFAARLPHFLCTLVTLFLTYNFANQYFGTRRAVISIIVLSACLGFTVTAGTVMTDSALLMATTLAMISFWRCFQGHNTTKNGLLFFAALSLGMLIKGPVAVVIIGIALTVWSISQRCFMSAITSLPWGKGLLLFTALTLPWYVWAELRTPGFLAYFIVGEHIQRFLVSGWQGDLYGTAHREPRGMIWLFWIGAAFPWSLVLIKQFISFIIRNAKGSPQKPIPPITSYLLCWMIAPLLLFTLSGNILPAYVLPGITAMGLLVTQWINSQRWLATLALVAYGLLLFFIAWVSFGQLSKTSEKELISHHMQQMNKTPLLYWQKRPFSAQFYSYGQAKLLTSEQTLANLLLNNNEFYIAIAHTETSDQLLMLSNQCKNIEQTRDRILFRCSKTD